MGLSTLDMIALLAWIVVPLTSVAVDIVPALRADRRRVYTVDDSTPICHDFEILVPIYGSLRYLENVEFLSAYGARVVLCTTTDETREFADGLDQLARSHSFRIFKAHVPDRRSSGSQRSVAAPIRDLLIREALATVTAPYVVCIDADTITERPIDQLVGAFADAGFDVASVRLLPSNDDTILARFQRHEYRMAMRMRRLYPWLVSGACHVARTNVHYEIMQLHSLFFQGNDAELGILADQMGYEVGHIAFDVPTTVPSQFKPWWRQRYAWVGGEFRIFFVNGRFALRHRYFYLYGAVIVTLLAPVRWIVVLAHPPVLIVVYGVFLCAFLVLNWSTRDWALVLLPFYTLFGSLVLVPMSWLSYLTMAMAHRNFGVIRPDRSVEAHTVAMRPVHIGAAIVAPGVTVKELQRSLAAVGQYGGAIDGRFGPLTRRSLIAWQLYLIDRGHDLGPGGANGVYDGRTAAASVREARWCGIDDVTISTPDWLDHFATCGAFQRPRSLAIA